MESKKSLNAKKVLSIISISHHNLNFKMQVVKNGSCRELNKSYGTGRLFLIQGCKLRIFKGWGINATSDQTKQTSMLTVPRYASNSSSSTVRNMKRSLSISCSSFASSASTSAPSFRSPNSDSA